MTAQQDGSPDELPITMIGSECGWNIFFMQLTEDNARVMKAGSVLNNELNVPKGQIPLFRTVNCVVT